MRTITRLTVIGVLALACALPSHAAEKIFRTSDPAVFRLVTVTPRNGVEHWVSTGTAFFISPDGTALTNHHVVVDAEHHPDQYQLLAVVGKEFYSVEIACAREVPGDPNFDRAVFGADVAEVRLLPSAFSAETFQVGPTGDVYRAHRAALPTFPTHPLGGSPKVGDHVVVVGYGLTVGDSSDPTGFQWASTGTVSDVGTAPDGTPLFRLVAARPPQPGHSGSPVMDPGGHVVGIEAWAEQLAPAGVAIGASALQHVCP